MPDELKQFLRNELAELKRNKIRASALAVCLAVLLIVWAVDDESGSEEILLDAPPVTVDLPAKPLSVTKSPDGVTLVLGANADEFVIGDPFAAEEELEPLEEPPAVGEPLPTIPPPEIPAPQPIIETTKPSEPVTLNGTAISGSNRTAMILRGKETLFLTIGDELDGRRIIDITPDSVAFDDGERIFLRKELK